MMSLAVIGLPLLADGDWVQILAALLFFLITGLAQFLQKKSRERRGLPPDLEPDPDVFEGPMAEPRRGLPPVAQQTGPRSLEDRLEEQFRRLVGEEQQPETSSPSSPPPLLAPAPVQRTPASFPQHDTWSRTPAEVSSFPEVRSLSERVSEAKSSAAEWLRETAAPKAASITSAAEAYLQSAALQDVRRELHRPRAVKAVASYRTRGAEVAAMFRKPETIRQAILASAILEAPKGLASSPFSERSF